MSSPEADSFIGNTTVVSFLESPEVDTPTKLRVLNTAKSENLTGLKTAFALPEFRDGILRNPTANPELKSRLIEQTAHPSFPEVARMASQECFENADNKYFGTPLEKILYYYDKAARSLTTTKGTGSATANTVTQQTPKGVRSNEINRQSGGISAPNTNKNTTSSRDREDPLLKRVKSIDPYSPSAAHEIDKIAAALDF